MNKAEPRGQMLYGNADCEVFTATRITVPAMYTHRLYLSVAFGTSTGVC